MRSVTKEKKEKYFKVLDLTNKNRPREKKGKKRKMYTKLRNKIWGLFYHIRSLKKKQGTKKKGISWH